MRLKIFLLYDEFLGFCLNYGSASRDMQMRLATPDTVIMALFIVVNGENRFSVADESESFWD